MKKLCLVFAFMLFLLLALPALAENEDSYLGTWYGYEEGSPMRWRFEKKGIAYLQPLGFEKEHKLKYTKKGNTIRTKWGKWEFEFLIEGDTLRIDNSAVYEGKIPDGLFTREPFEITLPSNDKITADKPEQFNGLWKYRYNIWWDSKYMYDLEHRGTSTFTYYYGVGLYYARFDAKNSQVEFLDENKEVRFVHSLAWKNGYYYDTDYKDSYYLMSDGSLMKGPRKNMNNSEYLYKVDE